MLVSYFYLGLESWVQLELRRIQEGFNQSSRESLLPPELPWRATGTGAQLLLQSRSRSRCKVETLFQGERGQGGASGDSLSEAGAGFIKRPGAVYLLLVHKT